MAVEPDVAVEYLPEGAYWIILYHRRTIVVLTTEDVAAHFYWQSGHESPAFSDIAAKENRQADW
ncbi:hypothetical protein [Pandoraea anhela]|nr:hypothetical protein [Pandoraea anhela]